MTSAQRFNITELWIAFGARKNFRYLPAHEMANALGLDSCVSLSMFLAFTGCDTVSCFGSRGKRAAWDMWNAYDEVTPAFCALAATPETVDNWLCPLERLLVLLYDCTSSQEFVNKARKQFTQKSRAIVLGQAVLIQHTKRAAHQAGHCWAKTMITSSELPSPSEWGWNRNVNDGWTTLSESTQASCELLRNGCNKGTIGLCKCLKRNINALLFATVVDCILVANV
ncbi:hypothetical protein NP493_848g03083 [Ridgeia piscesae]|uniref:Uncharacterized protein n=1 Tax=Ridgeia piscesae TaxID=27915 RepID=A0AAD9NNQ3_RIDPI|nr:hypothetical protein NP493_848g03083 [Ridgeia piscesae]